MLWVMIVVNTPIQIHILGNWPQVEVWKLKFVTIPVVRVLLYRLGWNWLNKIIPRNSGGYLIFLDGFGGDIGAFFRGNHFLRFFLNRPMITLVVHLV